MRSYGLRGNAVLAAPRPHPLARADDAERRRPHSHAERGNEIAKSFVYYAMLYYRVTLVPTVSVGMPSGPLCGPTPSPWLTTQSVEDCIPTRSVGTR